MAAIMAARYNIIHPDWRTVPRFQVGLPRTVTVTTEDVLPGTGVDQEKIITGGFFSNTDSSFAHLPAGIDPGTGIDEIPKDKRIIPGDFVEVGAGRKIVYGGGSDDDEKQIADKKLNCYMTVVDTGQMDKEISGGLTCAMPPFILQTRVFKQNSSGVAQENFKPGDELTLAEREDSGGYLWRADIEMNGTVDYALHSSTFYTAPTADDQAHFTLGTAGHAENFEHGGLAQLVNSTGTMVKGKFTIDRVFGADVFVLGEPTGTAVAADKLRHIGEPKQVPIFGICLDPPDASNEHVLTVQVVMPYLKQVTENRVNSSG